MQQSQSSSPMSHLMYVMHRQFPTLSSSSSVSSASASLHQTGLCNVVQHSTIQPRSHWVKSIRAATTFLAALLTVLATLPVGCHGNGINGYPVPETHHSARRRHSSSFDAGDVMLPASGGVPTPSTLSKSSATVVPSTTAPRRCPVRFRSETTQDANGTTLGTMAPPEGAVPVGSGWCRCLTTSGVDEIRCTGGGIGEVPDFDPVDRVFGGLYAVRQGIRGLRQAAFGHLKVKFTPIDLIRFVT